jgi:endonuclease/exonuclease/phosphatase family metal-dependent hydrolase
MAPKRTTGAVALILILVVTLLVPATPAGARGPHSIKVMTRNQYIGADLAPLTVAETTEQFVEAAKEVLTQVAASNFPRRALGFAREVFLTRPDVIALQEVEDISIDGQHPGPPFVDYLETTLDALAAFGLQYVVAAVVEHLDVTLEMDVVGDATPESVRVLDRDVILVRKGLSFQKLAGNHVPGNASTGLCGVLIENPIDSPSLPEFLLSQVSQDGCTYSVVGSVQSPIGPIAIERGFVGIDVRVDGKNYRIVNTHLEIRQPDPTQPASAIIQSLQAAELAQTLAMTTPADRTLITLGDFNSSPEDEPLGGITPPYEVLASAGLTDAWLRKLVSFTDPDGFTCCQNADLANPTSLLSERIDLIWVGSGGPFQALAVVTGRVPLLSSTAPRWASDHGGVASTLIFARDLGVLRATAPRGQ